MLPFLKLKNEAGASTSEKVERKPDQEEDLDLLEGCVQELHEALKSGDIKAAARALRDAFQVCDSEPHEEGPHV